MADSANQAREDIAKNPSDIAITALSYLDSLKSSSRQKELVEHVIFLFISSLKSNPASELKERSGDFVVCSHWRDYDPGIISEFLDWWFPAKVLAGGDLRKRAPAVLRKWITWCAAHQYIHEGQHKELLAELPRSKGRDIARLEKASNILYRLHSPVAWKKEKHENTKPMRFSERKAQWEDFVEGYMKVVKLGKNTCVLEDCEGQRFPSVVVGNDLAAILQVGDVMNVALGRFGRSWSVLESGNVYEDGAVF